MRGCGGDGRLDISYEVEAQLAFLDLSNELPLVLSSRLLWGLVPQLWNGVTMPAISLVGEAKWTGPMGQEEGGGMSPKDQGEVRCLRTHRSWV